MVERKKRVVPTKPSHCSAYLRGRLMDSIEKIADGFVKQAAAGSCQHLKLASELLEKGKPKEREKKGSAQRLLEKFGVMGQEHRARSQQERAGDGRFLGIRK